MIKRACIVSVFFLAGCGGGSGGGSSSQVADLQGQWVSECTVDGDDSERDELSITGNNFVFSNVSFFNQTDCSGELTLQVNFPGTIAVNGTTTQVAEGLAKHLDITYSTGNVTASAAAEQSLAAQGTSVESILAAQGLNDINNIPLDLIGLDQPTVYSIYLVIGNDLYTGSFDNGLDGTTPDLRPNSVDNDFTRR